MTWDDLIEGRDPASAPLTDAYREIRRIAPPDAPWPARLAADGAEVVMLVDADVLTGWAGWTRAEAQHVLMPADVARRVDGHDVVLAWCVHPLERLLPVHEDAAELAGGAIVTLAVSLLRGAEEAWRGLPGDAAGPTGRWWLTDGGRPVFVDGEGEPVAEEATRLVTEMARRCTDRVLRPALEETVEALSRPRALKRSIEGIETRLFEACAPQPLRPEADDQRASALRAGDERVMLRRDAKRTSQAKPGAGRGAAVLRTLLERHVDGGVADTVADALHRTTRWLRSRKRVGGRRAPWLVAGGVAVAVLVGGLAWPSAESGTDARAQEAVGRDAGALSPRAKDPATVQEGEAAEEDDPVAIAARLLDGLEVCRTVGDQVCSDVREDAEGELPRAERMPSADERRLTLIEDYGGVAVVRAEAPGSKDPPMVVTMVREGERWLIRDIQDLG